MKIAINLGLAVQMLAFSEAVLLAEKSGIARARAVEALLKSVIASPMIKYRGPFVLGMPAEAWFNVPMIQKDLELALGARPRDGRPAARDGADPVDAHIRAGAGPRRLRLRRRVRRAGAARRPAAEPTRRDGRAPRRDGLGILRRRRVVRVLERRGRDRRAAPLRLSPC